MQIANQNRKPRKVPKKKQKGHTEDGLPATWDDSSQELHIKCSFLDLWRTASMAQRLLSSSSMLASTPSTYLGGVTAIRIHVNTVRTWRESRGDVLCHVLAAGFSALVGAVDNRDAGCTIGVRSLPSCCAPGFLFRLLNLPIPMLAGAISDRHF